MNDMVNVANLGNLHNSGSDKCKTMADNVTKEFITPVASAYKILGDDWFGSAAANHYPNVKVLHDNMVSLQNFIAELGEKITEIAATMDEFDTKAGGTSRGLTKTTITRYSDILTIKEKLPEQTFRMSPKSIPAVNSLRTVVNSIDTLVGQVDTLLEEVFTNWTAGGNPSSFRTSISSALDRIKSMKNEANLAVEAMEAGVKVISSLGANSAASGNGNRTDMIN